MRGRLAGLAAGALMAPILALGQQPQTPLKPVRYYITFVPGKKLPPSITTGNKLPPETERILMRCLPDLCSTEKLLGPAQCPVTEICENVEVTETYFDGGGASYKVVNELTNGEQHPQIWNKAFGYSTVTDLEDARDRAWTKIRLKVLCHNQTVHAKRDVVSVNNPAPVSAPGPSSECVCK